MAEEALFKLAPGFKNDENESWAVYLPSEMQISLKKERADFIKLSDLRSSFRTKWLQDDKRPDPATSSEYQAKWNKYTEKIQKKAQTLVKQIKAYQKEAMKLRDEQVAKRPRLDEEIVDEISDFEDDDLELVTDDYLPSYLPYEQTNDPVPMELDAPQPPPKAPLNPLTDIPYFEESTFLKDVTEADAEILTALKELIMKYNCRERVMKALTSYRSREATEKGLAVYDQLIPVFKPSAKGNKN